MGGEKVWRERGPRRRRSAATEAEEEAEALGDGDLADPAPDLRELFRHYDALYFRGALAAAGFAVQWSSAVSNRTILNTSSFGSCTFLKPSNTITLSESMLRYCSTANLKNALLHEMIHAILYLKHQMKSCSTHGPMFRAWMDAINSCSIADHQRPHNGYTITTRHDFGPEEPHSIRGFLWKCKSCGDTLVRAKNQGPPSDVLCIENVNNDETCGNMLCRWHNHKEKCRGKYEKVAFTDQKEDPRGTQLLLTYTSDISKPQESDADALQGNATVPKTNADGKFLSLVSTINANSLGSNSKGGGKRRRLEDVQKASPPLTSPLRKLKLNKSSAASEVHELFSPVSSKDTKLLGASTSKMGGRQCKPEDVQESSVPPAATQRKLKHDLVASENCSNATVLPATSQSKMKKSNFAALENQKSKCKRKPAREKEYAVMSAWLNYYESEGSSGSTEPLVNKRTVRRKRARYQIAVYSRSRKQINSAPREFSRVNAFVSCQKIKTEPHKDETSQQRQPLPPCLDIVVTTTDVQMVTQATGDQSQLSAPCLDIVAAGTADQVVPLQWDFPAGPAGSSYESIGTDMIDISDDD